ncbi:hypothetical protein ACKKBG_A16580 [Auxenochlorella protothecoides x Auxenochlorella symbiontica]
MANLGYPARALEGPVTDLDGGVVEGPTSPARRKLLLANSAITPCNRLEWSLAAGAPNQADEEANLDASLPTRFPSQDASPSSSFTSIMHSMRPRPLSAEPDAGLYDAPIWMLCCYALSQLPGQRGSLACIHATLAALLCGHVVLPWVNQLHKYLATSSLDGRGIQKHVTTEGQREYQLHEDCIPSVLKPGWLHFKRWASLQTQSSQPGTSKQHTFSAFTLFA